MKALVGVVGTQAQDFVNPFAGSPNVELFEPIVFKNTLLIK
jgi:hypothetical protein